jgi:thymidine kinase
MLHVITGPMYSGKTSELIRLKNRAEVAKNKCLVIKYHDDSRYDLEKLSTHDQIKTEAVSSIGNSLSDTISSIKFDELDKYQYIFIDEGQFYNDGAEVCDSLANRGFKVIVAALQGDYLRKPIGCVPELLAYADKITHLTAIDSETGEDAPFTSKISDKSIDNSGKLIGGKETYRAVSRKNWK